MIPSSLVLALAVPTPWFNPPGSYRVSWIGNTCGGDMGGNGRGRWIQNSADEVEVTPDGTIVASSDWDEAGRCLGLYRKGSPNIELLKLPDEFANEAWGWGVGSHALAVEGKDIAVVNMAGRLCRFTWTPGDLESPRFKDQAMAGPTEAMTATKDHFVLSGPQGLQWRRRTDLGLAREVKAPPLKDIAASPEGALWVIHGGLVRRLNQDGSLGSSLPDAGAPAALSFDPQGRLIVCDGGPRQQVLVHDVQGRPRRIGSFGLPGGAKAVKGVWHPQALFALRGAGRDRDGGWHVAMGFAGGPVGTLTLRSFTKKGDLAHELHNGAFVDTFGFDPDSDGTVVHSRLFRYSLDLGKAKPGSEWSLSALTLDPNDPKAGRGSSPGTALIRRPSGRPVLYVIGQYAGGFSIHSWDKGSSLASWRSEITQNDRWAWAVDSEGTIWQGDSEGQTIRSFPLLGWKGEAPLYDPQRFASEPWPQGWQLIRRVEYDAKQDRMMISGYRTGEKIETWGVAGSTLIRYDGWRKGLKQKVWEVKLPRDHNTDPNEGPLTPSSLAFAGDFIFAGMVKPHEGQQYVHILRLSDGAHIGAFRPLGSSGVPAEGVGPEGGWLDMPYSVQAFKRKNGEYLILAEEDFRGKNWLYRWRPAP